MTDITKLTEGTVAEAKAELANLTDDELVALKEADDRSTLHDAIEREQESRESAKESNIDREAWGRGRVAHGRKMGRDNVTRGADKASWQAGWDHEEARYPSV